MESEIPYRALRPLLATFTLSLSKWLVNVKVHVGRDGDVEAFVRELCRREDFPEFLVRSLTDLCRAALEQDASKPRDLVVLLEEASRSSLLLRESHQWWWERVMELEERGAETTTVLGENGYVWERGELLRGRALLEGRGEGPHLRGLEGTLQNERGSMREEQRREEEKYEDEHSKMMVERAQRGVEEGAEEEEEKYATGRRERREQRRAMERSQQCRQRVQYGSYMKTLSTIERDASLSDRWIQMASTMGQTSSSSSSSQPQMIVAAPRRGWSLLPSRASSASVSRSASNDTIGSSSSSSSSLSTSSSNVVSSESSNGSQCHTSFCMMTNIVSHNSLHRYSVVSSSSSDFPSTAFDLPGLPRVAVLIRDVAPDGLLERQWIDGCTQYVELIHGDAHSQLQAAREALHRKLNEEKIRASGDESQLVDLNVRVGEEDMEGHVLVTRHSGHPHCELCMHLLMRDMEKPSLSHRRQQTRTLLTSLKRILSCCHAVGAGTLTLPISLISDADTLSFMSEEGPAWEERLAAVVAMVFDAINWNKRHPHTLRHVRFTVPAKAGPSQVADVVKAVRTLLHKKQ